MKVFLLAPRENWIVDRFVEEWKSFNKDVTTDDPYEADVIWLVADWCSNQLPYDLLRQKRVITSVHHITPEKFGPAQLQEFLTRDAVTDVYHVPCHHTKNQVEQILSSKQRNKRILVQPFWVNQDLWFPVTDRLSLREKYKLPTDKFLVGSFQRDTEGHDLISPKKEKGPDLFCDAVIALQHERNDVEVVLAGWRRQYVMRRLDEAGIKYHYFERPNYDAINDLYNSIDLYVVAARWEGGPQAIVECALTETPIVSTNVGLAPMILHDHAIFDANDVKSFLTAVKFSRSPAAIEIAKKSVSEHQMPQSFTWYHKTIFELQNDEKASNEKLKFTP